MRANKGSARGLGRGLDALFGNMPGRIDGENCLLAVDSVAPNPDQPRRHFDEVALKELAASIEKDGILQPLLVRPAGEETYQIVSGERRWRAARMVGLKQVPAVIRAMDDNEVLAAALIENLQRENLNVMEEARAMKRLVDALSITQDSLAERLGKSRSSVSNAMRMLQLDEAAQEDLIQGRISAGHARCLLALEDDSDAVDILRRHVVERGITVREAEDAVDVWRKTGFLPKHVLKPEMAETPAGRSDDAATPLRRSRRKPRWTLTVQRLIGKSLCRSSISGDVSMGRITLRYGSAEELKRILQRLGVDASAVDQEAGGDV